jgi:hypothetical protein
MGETFDVRYTEPVEGRRGNLDAPELAWEDTMKAVLAKGSPRTVALCGFANSSRHLAPYDNPDVEICLRIRLDTSHPTITRMLKSGAATKQQLLGT